MPPALLRLERSSKSGQESKRKSLREKAERAVPIEADKTAHKNAHKTVHNTVLKCRCFFVCETRAPDSLENGVGYLATSGAFSKCPLFCGAGSFFRFFAENGLKCSPRGDSKGGGEVVLLKAAKTRKKYEQLLHDECNVLSSCTLPYGRRGARRYAGLLCGTVDAFGYFVT
jgi:hypothetical protein